MKKTILNKKMLKDLKNGKLIMKMDCDRCKERKIMTDYYSINRHIFCKENNSWILKEFLNLHFCKDCNKQFDKEFQDFWHPKQVN